MVTIIDPHIKKDESYYIYQEALQSKYFVRNKDGTDYDGCALFRPRQCSRGGLSARSAVSDAQGLATGIAGGAGPGPRSTWTC